MRSARTSIAIILMLCLLAVPVGATGQSSDAASTSENEATEPVYVTWTGAATGEFNVPPETKLFQWGERGYAGWRATQSSDDPRIRGRHTTVMLGDGPMPPEAGEAGRFTTLVRIENDDGAWQGWVTDVFLPDNSWLQYGWLKGEDAYEGLSFFTSGRFNAASSLHKGEGMIWPSDPPPAPDPALLAAELDR